MKHVPANLSADTILIGASRTKPPKRGAGVLKWLWWGVATAIRYCTRSDAGEHPTPILGSYSHLFLWHPASGTVWEAVTGGFQRHYIEAYDDPRLVVDVYDAGLTTEQAETVILWCEKMVESETPYDFLQILRILGEKANMPWEPENLPDLEAGALICSEAVLLAHAVVGVDLSMDIPAWAWTPDHIVRAKRERLVRLQGRLRFDEGD